MIVSCLLVVAWSFVSPINGAQEVSESHQLPAAKCSEAGGNPVAADFARDVRKMCLLNDGFCGGVMNRTSLS